MLKMKKILFIIFIIYTTSHSFGQNLVSNPSFEDTVYCPYFTGLLDPLEAWSTFGNSPDVYNSCAQFMTIPNSPFGYQYAHSGQGMLGIVSYVWQYSPGWPDYREYAGSKLKDTLIIGEKYYFSFYTNCAGLLPGWQIIGTNKIGVKFSTVPYDSLNLPELNNFAHIYTDSILTDTVNWFKVAGTFIADSSYTYIVLGNFFDEQHTDTVIFGGAPFGGSVGYYYLDDVSLSRDSIIGLQLTSLNENITEAINIYPNPASNKVYLEFRNVNTKIENLSIINVYGQHLKKITIDNLNKQEINIDDLNNGFYLFQFMHKDKIVSKNRIIIQR